VNKHTREVLALHVDRYIGSRKVCEVMEGLIAEHGTPGFIRSDSRSCIPLRKGNTAKADFHKSWF
jgi:hypothetical protein